MEKKYNIFYDDGAYYGQMIFSDSSQTEIENSIQEEIVRNNKSPNPLWHIKRKNFKEI